MSVSQLLRAITRLGIKALLLRLMAVVAALAKALLVGAVARNQLRAAACDFWRCFVFRSALPLRAKAVCAGKGIMPSVVFV